MDSPRKYRFARKIEEVARLESQGVAHEDLIEKELERMNLQPGMTVLDAGCGTGVVSRKIARRISPGTVYAVDTDPVFTKKARKIAAKKDINNIKFELDDINNLSYDDDVFDASYCRLVLMHLQDPIQAVTELKRVSKKSGLVAVSDIDDAGTIFYPTFPHAMKLLTQFAKLARKQGEDRNIGRKLFSIFSQAGLTSIEIFPHSLHATKEYPKRMKKILSVPLHILEASKETMMNQDYLTVEEYEEGIEEFQQLLTHPRAFVMITTFLAHGKVPDPSQQQEKDSGRV